MYYSVEFKIILNIA